jgi:hypothetical protein
MSKIEKLSQELLYRLLVDFTSRNIGSQYLTPGYVGVLLETLKQKRYADDCSSDVDFDLALSDLVKTGLVKTGPLVPYDNPPGSSLIVLTLFNKREYAYLTANGYKAAQKAGSTQRRSPAANSVHISGGTFHYSPIGIGGQITQSVTTVSEAPVFMDLRNAVTESGIESGDRAELLTRIGAMEEAHKGGAFLERYRDFIACAANYMAIVAPFLAPLSELLK